jgi:hypothetical protein
LREGRRETAKRRNNRDMQIERFTGKIEIVRKREKI